MTKQQKQTIALGALAVLFGVVLYSSLFAPDEELARIEENRKKAEEQRKARAAQSAGTSTSRQGPQGKRRAPAPRSRFAATDVTLEELDRLMESIKTVDFNYDTAHLRSKRTRRDPMAPLVGPNAAFREVAGNGGFGDAEHGPGLDDTFARILQAQAMTVTGIIWDKDNPIAVVDNEVVHEGYVFPEAIVVDTIEDSRVLLRVDDRIVPLKLKEQ